MISLWQPIISTIFIWLVVWAAINIGCEKRFSATIGVIVTLTIWVIYAIS